MSSREISLWLDERWYDAISKHLVGETLEEHLEDVLDQMCNQLPEREYERISCQIHEEQHQLREEREAAQRFAVFHVIEDGREGYFQVERNLEMLDAARLLRAYLRQSDVADSFEQTLYDVQEISAEQFLSRSHERQENTGKVTGAFVLDFDKEQFSALHIMDGWKSYSMKDVSTAIYYADRKDYISRNARWERFTDKLTGKELHSEYQVSALKCIEGTQRLQPSEINVEGEVLWTSETLEFYVPVYFDTSKVFGEQIADAPHDSYVNVYAYYDLETQDVRDNLVVVLCRGDGTEEDFTYKLNSEEKNMFRERMNEVCIKCGADLAECHEEYLREKNEAQQRDTEMAMRL